MYALAGNELRPGTGRALPALGASPAGPPGIAVAAVVPAGAAPLVAAPVAADLWVADGRGPAPVTTRPLRTTERLSATASGGPALGVQLPP